MKYFINFKRNVVALEEQDVIYAQQDKRNVNIHMYDGKIIRCRGKLVDVEVNENSTFCRCHSYLIVNVQHINKVVDNEIIFDNKEIAYTSHNYASKLSHHLLEKYSYKNEKNS